MESHSNISDTRIEIDKIYTEEYIIHSKLIKNMEYIEDLKIKHTELINIFTKIFTNLSEKSTVH